MLKNNRPIELYNKKGEIICPVCKNAMFIRDYGRWLERKLKSSTYIFTNVPYGLRFILHKECKINVNVGKIKQILKRLKFVERDGIT